MSLDDAFVCEKDASKNTWNSRNLAQSFNVSFNLLGVPLTDRKVSVRHIKFNAYSTETEEKQANKNRR